MARTLWRVVAICALLVVLVGLFVSLGTVQPRPANNDFPGQQQLLDDQRQHVGDRVYVVGTVVDTDPLTIRTTPQSGRQLTFVIEDADSDPAVGDELWVFGVLQAEGEVRAIDTVRQQPSEVALMYVVSFLAGLWVLGRLLNQWTLDTDDWAVVPRETPYLEK